ncbi:hypothetical protein PR202_gb24763 [Eleusine coracana subsp. coracana]|uniref:6-phosphofructo-2-kinase domain-containing protein n=1 Tax=Eleusine coracana subsp. coracana TaxID=191504 RepID=A0AAV5FMB5_ELECO|nr:hypothetical protein PR202_gb24763 [Eleusine coracana subsp. coracana]
MGEDEMLEFRVFNKADTVSPLDLAASWRVYKENFQPSKVRGIPDISINVEPTHVTEDGPSASLELDLEHYVVPSPTAPPVEYAANLAATPASLIQTGATLTNDMLLSDGIQSPGSVSTDLEDQNTHKKNAEALVSKKVQTSGLVESKSVGTFTPLQKQDGQKGFFIDRGVGSLKLPKSASFGSAKTMPEAAGAVAAAAVADRLHGSKEDRKLAIILVAALAMEDMIDWMHDGGQVGIFDATNSTRKRRHMLMKMAEGNCKVHWTLINEIHVFWTDFEAGLQDFTERLKNYEKVYEPVGEGSYIKMIDMVKGQGGQLQVNSHLAPRPILLTRHGESLHNVRGRVGGDTVLSENGELYAKKLANFVEKRLKNEKTATIWTSTLQRTILTASPIVGFPKIQWRALDEINSGVCDGMTYEEIKKIMPEEFESRRKDKLRYRYPRGESYLDVIQRLEPVIIELERQRAPVVVISHQAVLRALYAYFADRPLREVPDIEMPLHTIIEIQMGVTGVEEKRYKLMEDECQAH